nr:ribosomal protein S15 [Chlorokybus atmophyticus]
MSKKTLINNYAIHTSDTGSTQVQVALLTAKVIQLSQHLNNHNKDYASQRGLRKILGRRKQLLKYLSHKDPVSYQGLISKLGIRALRSN